MKCWIIISVLPKYFLFYERLFMRLRTNDMFNLGVLGSDNVVRFSPYIVVKKPDEVDPVNIVLHFSNFYFHSYILTVALNVVT